MFLKNPVEFLLNKSVKLLHLNDINGEEFVFLTLSHISLYVPNTYNLHHIV